jgi:methionine synthase II (cobalamin-independent)
VICFVMKITRMIYIEDLVRELPASVRYLREKGIKCLECGEPVWGTLEEAARVKGFADEDIDRFVDDLKKMSADKD